MSASVLTLEEWRQDEDGPLTEVIQQAVSAWLIRELESFREEEAEEL